MSMKERLMLIRYTIEYAKFDKLTYKLLSKPASEQDEQLLDEYIQTKDMYAAQIIKIRESIAAKSHYALKRGLATALTVLLLLVAGTGIAEAAGFHIWREVFSLGKKHIVVHGTDNVQNAKNPDYVYVDATENSRTYTYSSIDEANMAVGVNTGLQGSINGFAAKNISAKFLDDIVNLDVTYEHDGVSFVVRVTVINGDDDFAAGFSINSDAYTEQDISGVTCSINAADDVINCLFIKDGEGARCMYSIRTNADMANLEEFVRAVVLN